MKHYPICALSLVLSLCSLPAFAADSLSLQEAIDRAIASHPSLQAARAELEAARAREAQARGPVNPSVSLQANEMPLTDPGNGNFLAGVTLPLTPGARAARVETARLETAIAETEVQDAERELVKEVKSAYARLLHSTEHARMSRTTLQDFERLLAAAEARYRSGDVPRIEVFRAEVERNRAQREVSIAQSAQDLAQSRLALLVGQDPDADLEVATASLPTIRQLPPVADLRVRMTAARPELRRAELAIAQEREQKALARANVWEGTEVSVGGGLAEGAPALSTSLSVPLPLNRNEAAVAAADALMRQAEARREALRLRFEAELREAHQAASTALLRWTLLSESDLPQARRFADNARRRYLAGEGSGLETTEAARTLRAVEGEHLQALLDYREALARLEATIASDLSP